MKVLGIAINKTTILFKLYRIDFSFNLVFSEFYIVKNIIFEKKCLVYFNVR